jgi:hypothetical protein
MTDECAGERHAYDRFPSNIGGVRWCGVWHRISALTCRLAVIFEALRQTGTP